MTRRSLFLTVAVLMLAVGAWAAKAHFISYTPTISGNTLTVTYKIAGLGNGTFTTILSADVDWDCQSSSGTLTHAHRTISNSQQFSTTSGNFEGAVSVTPTCPGNVNNQDVVNTVYHSFTLSIYNSAGQLVVSTGPVPL